MKGMGPNLLEAGIDSAGVTPLGETVLKLTALPFLTCRNSGRQALHCIAAVVERNFAVMDGYGVNQWIQHRNPCDWLEKMGLAYGSRASGPARAAAAAAPGAACVNPDDAATLQATNA
jgi:hypothetical protein